MGDRYIVIEKFQGKTFVKIRDYRQIKTKCFPSVPGRGINLTVPEWECLRTMVPAIVEAVQESEVS